MPRPLGVRPVLITGTERHSVPRRRPGQAAFFAQAARSAASSGRAAAGAARGCRPPTGTAGSRWPGPHRTGPQQGERSRQRLPQADRIAGTTDLRAPPRPGTPRRPDAPRGGRNGRTRTHRLPPGGPRGRRLPWRPGTGPLLPGPPPGTGEAIADPADGTDRRNRPATPARERRIARIRARPSRSPPFLPDGSWGIPSDRMESNAHASRCRVPGSGNVASGDRGGCHGAGCGRRRRPFPVHP